MVDVFVKGRRRRTRVNEDREFESESAPVRRKRPNKAVDPDETETFATQARVERKARLRVPLHRQLVEEGYDDNGIALPLPDAEPEEEMISPAPSVTVRIATKADIREVKDDRRREKNANIRDRQNEVYAARRALVLEQWADKDERRARRERGREIIAARRESEMRRNAMLEGEGLPEMDAMLGSAPTELCERISAREARLARLAPAKPVPLLQLLEEQGPDALPTKFRDLVDGRRRESMRKGKF